MLCFVNFDIRKYFLCKVFTVSKFPQCQIVRGVKLSANIAGVKLSWCQIVLKSDRSLTSEKPTHLKMGVKIKDHTWGEGRWWSVGEMVKYSGAFFALQLSQNRMSLFLQPVQED